MQSIITVFHEIGDDGWHKFTSLQVEGLLLAVEEKNLKTAYNEIPAILEQLIEIETGRTVTVRPQKTFAEHMEEAQSLRHYSVEVKDAA